MTAVLGISAFYHDSAACLVVDGRVTAAAQEERFSREKHDPSFPRRAVAYCLEEGGLEPSDLERVAFYEKPWVKFERILTTSLAVAPRGYRPFVRAMPVWLKKKLWIHRFLRRELGYDGPIVFPEHHQSHAASAFYASPFDRAAVLTLDGVGEWCTAARGRGDGAELRLEEELRFPHSLGLLYSAFTYYTGFRVNSGEYKMMGLAPFGEPRFADRILADVMDLRPDGSFRLDLDYFRFHRGMTMTSPAFHRLFGGRPRRPDEPIEARHADAARSAQAVTEEVLLRMARDLRRRTGEESLCMAGGVALNSVANGRLRRSGVFEDVWIQPAAGDAGGALGAALFAWHRILGRARDPSSGGDRQRASRLGPRFAPREIREWLEEGEVPHRALSDDGAVRAAADLLADGEVVGWFQGRMEYGPRALGGRSILADARRPEMQSVLNRKIKGRESFRPFAPACLREEADGWFALVGPSPYMLQVVPVRESRLLPSDTLPEAEGLERVRVPRSEVPAVTHVDGSARVQTVDRGDHPRFHALLRAFRERTGCPVLVNTSFNRSGEPIVCTPGEAYRCFVATEMDALVLGNCLLTAEGQAGGPTPGSPATEQADAGTGTEATAWR